MGVVIIFALVSILSLIGLIRSIKDKGILAVGLSLISFLLFGWFSVMTLIDKGWPGGH